MPIFLFNVFATQATTTTRLGKNDHVHRNHMPQNLHFRRDRIYHSLTCNYTKYRKYFVEDNFGYTEYQKYAS